MDITKINNRHKGYHCDKCKRHFMTLYQTEDKILCEEHALKEFKLSKEDLDKVAIPEEA